ncbi:hypothetical protein EGW08_001280 [Elysia chlorotica]|uniref:Uncharacterized protein n=1 Tax=Elysia chlorotica TaxID=188477 RepID=A0A433UB03_ELYCH|nr:hypothetical protein EGW08_001280 [Elysia chlorotica]
MEGARFSTVRPISPVLTLVLVLLSTSLVFGFSEQNAAQPTSKVSKAEAATASIAVFPGPQQQALPGNQELPSSNKQSFQEELTPAFTGEDAGDVDDKRFIQGLVNKRFINGLVGDKRFINGLVGDKRFINGLVGDKRFINGIVDKRFLKGLTAKRSSAESDEGPLNFSRGDGTSGLSADTDSELDTWPFDGYGDDFSDIDEEDGDMEPSEVDIDEEDVFDEDKRFMHGLVPPKRFLNGLVQDKRFMRGLVPNKRFLNGLVSDKRFMHGLVPGKRFMHGLVPGKRFMHGLVPGKRFMRGLVPGKRFMHGLVPGKRDKDGLVPTDKRFMHGLVPGKRFMHGLVPGKRFMRGLVPDKRFINGIVENDKRFLQGLVPNQKRFINGLTPANKRFINGLVPDDKRFMKGLVKRSADNMADLDLTSSKRFMHGLVRKSTGSDDEEMAVDKKFMRGLVRKSDVPLEKKFMRGLVRKSNYPLEKKFMRGLVRKSDIPVDKKFMRGLVRKSNQEQELGGNADKRFIQGLVRKDDKNVNRYFRFDDGLSDLGGEGFRKRADEDAQEYSGQEKSDMSDNVIAGTNREVDREKPSEHEDSLNKEDSANDNHEPMLEKKFMKGLVKKDAGAEKNGQDRDFKNVMGVDKKFINGIVASGKRSDEIVNPHNNDYDKRFLRGVVKKDASGDQSVNSAAGQAPTVSGNYRMKRSTSFDDSGSTYNNGPEGTWFDSPVIPSASFAVPDKKFIRGLIRRDDLLNYYNSGRSSGPANKRFIHGLVRRFNDDFSPAGDDADSSAHVDKRFIRGLIPRSGSLSEHFKQWRPTYSTDSRQDKRFLMGLTNPKRSLASYIEDSDSEEPPSKRFIMGLVKHYNPSSYNPYSSQGSRKYQTGYHTRSSQA